MSDEYSWIREILARWHHDDINHFSALKEIEIGVGDEPKSDFGSVFIDPVEEVLTVRFRSAAIKRAVE